MTVEYKGDDFLYLVEIGEGTKKTARPFNQTDGSSNIESDDIELKTKDKTGTDYASVSESVSIEGVLTKGDEAVAFIKGALRAKKLVRILAINTTDMSTEEGLYKIDSFEQTNSTGDFAQYSLEAKLNGVIKEGTLDTLPEGAPEAKADSPVDG